MGDETVTPRKRRAEKTTWVLQAPRQIDDITAWVDVATVEVPASTRRKTAIKRALVQWGASVPEEGTLVRLVRAEDAEPVRVRPKPPEPVQLEIG